MLAGLGVHFLWLCLLLLLTGYSPQAFVLQFLRALVTAFGTIDRSVQAMREGAADYLVKPFRPAQLIEAVSRFTPAGRGLRDDEPVAVSPMSIELLGLARQVAASDSTVLLCGESGSGKEVMARLGTSDTPVGNAA